MFFAKPYWDALIVILILLLFFGPKRLPALGRSLGQGMREFKDSISGKSHESEEAERPELNAAAPAQTPAENQPAEPATVAAPQRSEGTSAPDA